MEINLEKLKEITKKIQVILSACSNATNLNIKSSTNNDALYFSLTTGEIYSAIKLIVSTEANFNATVDAKAFVNMVLALPGDTIKLSIEDNVLKLSAGKSKYKLAMVFTEGVLVEPKPILVENPETKIILPLNILKSINTVNSQEFNRRPEAKIKNIANKLYHISDVGCFTAADGFGACLNSFKLSSHFEILATRQLVKLFSLFDTDPLLTYENKQVNSIDQTVINLTSANVRLCAYTPADARIKSIVTSMVTKIRRRAAMLYQVNLVLNVKELSAALGRLAIASKTDSLPGSVKLLVAGDHITFIDRNENSEEVMLDPASNIIGNFSTSFIVSDVKSVIDLCKEPMITIRTEMGKPLVFDFDSVKYMLVPLSE